MRNFDLKTPCNSYPFFSGFFLKVRNSAIVLVFVILGVTENISYGQISFAPYQVYQTGSLPEVVCIGDVNNDGLNDVVMGTGYYPDPVDDYKIFVYLQDTNGNLSAPFIYSYLEVHPGIKAIAINDLNNDNLNDVIIGFGDSVGIFYQNASGGLNSVQTYFSGYSQNSNSVDGLCTGDLNHDGLNDIAISHGNAPFISVMYQQSGGGFSMTSYPSVAGVVNQIEIEDVNNDQLDDVIQLVGGMSGGGFYTFTQNISGTLNNYVSYPNYPGQVSANGGMAIGDLNNDGINDIVKTVFSNFPNSRIAIYFQNPFTNLFQTPLILPAYDCAGPIQIADLNCDGRNEIILANSGWDRISVYEQDAGNNYYSYSLFNITHSDQYKHHGICVGDINNDNKKDVLVASYTFGINTGLLTLMNNSNLYGICCTLPVLPAIPNGDTTICQENDTSTYWPIIPYSGNISWNLLPAQAGTIYSSSNDSCSVVWNNAWRGNASIYISATNTCGTRYSDTLNISVSRLPVVNLGNDTTLCPLDTLELSAGYNYLTSYLWQDNSTDSIYTVTAGGTYYIESSNVCGIISDTIIVQSVSIPIVNLGNDTILCTGSTIQFDVTLPGNNYYLWQDNSTNPVLTVSNPGIYSVTITDSNNCHNTQSVMVSELSAPDITLHNDTIFCDTINLVIDLHYPGCSYLWQDNSSDSTYMITQAGEYSYTVSNVCGNETDSIIVYEIPLPVIDLPNDTSLCSGETLILDVTQQGGYPYHYLWQDGSTESLFFITDQGDYTIIVSDSSICQVSKTIDVKELTAPEINFPVDTSICIDARYTLDAYFQGSNYLWHDGSTSAQYIVQDSGEYAVTVYNFCGSASDTTHVNIIDCTSYLDVPSAFSPNGDGINDILFAVGKNIENFNFVIYDRWGEKIFEAKDLSTGWDGTFKEKILDANVFMYRISATSTIDGHGLQKEGNVSLIR